MSVITRTPLRPNAIKERRRRGVVAAIFLLPAFILFCLFFVGPGALGRYYSFTDYKGYGIPEFIGRDDYKGLFTDGDFYASLTRTFLYTIATVPFGYIHRLLISVLAVSKAAKAAALAHV